MKTKRLILTPEQQATLLAEALIELRNLHLAQEVSGANFAPKIAAQKKFIEQLKNAALQNSLFTGQVQPELFNSKSIC
jgi:hypothetical protein